MRRLLFILIGFFVLLGGCFIYIKNLSTKSTISPPAQVELSNENKVQIGPDQTHDISKTVNRRKLVRFSQINKGGASWNNETIEACIDILDETCLGEYSEVFKNLERECAINNDCEHIALLGKALAVLKYSQNNPLNEKTTVETRALRLLGLSITGADNKTLIDEAKIILDKNPEFDSVRNLRLGASFAEYQTTNDLEMLDSIKSDIQKLREVPDSDTTNADTAEFILDIQKNISPDQILARLKSSRSDGYAFYLESIWAHKNHDLKRMQTSLAEAIIKEPDNEEYRKTMDILTTSKDPFSEKGAFKLDLKHGEIL